jgi:hypothetical protein
LGRYEGNATNVDCSWIEQGVAGNVQVIKWSLELLLDVFDPEFGVRASVRQHRALAGSVDYRDNNTRGRFCSLEGYVDANASQRIFEEL